ncbi:MAG: chorismate mutase [bacterium]|nr:chorismate mutase [bacterium]
MKDRLDQLRKRILDIDAELVRLLAERASIALEIGRIKSDLGVPLQDPDREREVLKNARRIPHHPLQASQVDDLFSRILEICRDAQIQAAPAAGSGRS